MLPGKQWHEQDVDLERFLAETRQAVEATLHGVEQQTRSHSAIPGSFDLSAVLVEERGR